MASTSLTHVRLDAEEDSDPENMNSARLPNVRDINFDFRALHETYDAVVDIHSIRHAKMGWGICGKNWRQLELIFARLVGVVGDFKDGKTFVISLLSQRQLPHNATKHTPGICLTLSRLPSAPQKVSAGPSKPSHHAQSTMEQGLELLQNCFIDTEGTDQPVTEGATDDIRATEFLVRNLVVELAGRLLYVTRKWGYHTQTKINNLIKLVNANPKTTKIAPVNPLIIIHNHPEVMKAINLVPWIEEVRNSYRDAEIPKDRMFENAQRWTEINIGDSPHKYYQSIMTTHYFLMNNDIEEGKTYNEGVAAHIRTVINQTQGKKVDFINDIRASAAVHMEKYVKGWTQEKCTMEKFLDGEEEYPMIAPAARSDDIPACIQDNEEPFTLHRIEFTGHSIKTAGYNELEGRVLVDKNSGKMMVQIKAAGTAELSNQYVRVHAHLDAHTLLIRIQQPVLPIPEGFVEQRSSLYSGIGYYQATLDDPLRFVSCKAAEWYQKMKLDNGILTLNLDLKIEEPDFPEDAW